MPVIKASDIKTMPIVMPDASAVEKANVIGPDEGWSDHTLRVFALHPGGHTPHHSHDWEHINYIIRGRGTLQIGDEKHSVGAGDYAFVPANTEHQFKNAGAEPFEFICIVPNRGAY